MTGARTTWRTNWWVLPSHLAVFAVAFTVGGLALNGRHTLSTTAIALVAYGLVTIPAHALWKVSVTPAGLDVSNLGTTAIPWADISAVSVVGERCLARQIVLVGGAGQTRKLRAPTSFLGLGNATVAEAATEIERWWRAYREVPPPVISPADETTLWAPPPP